MAPATAIYRTRGRPLRPPRPSEPQLLPLERCQVLGQPGRVRRVGRATKGRGPKKRLSRRTGASGAFTSRLPRSRFLELACPARYYLARGQPQECGAEHSNPSQVPELADRNQHSVPFGLPTPNGHEFLGHSPDSRRESASRDLRCPPETD